MRGQLHENRSPFDYYRRLRKLRSYVESHISEPLSLEDASRIVGLEKKYFSTFFSQKTGMGFRDWSAALRVERAKVLMSQSDHSITRVSVAVGFRDLRTFERAFKKHTGVTPMVFKQSIRPDRRGPRGRSHSAHDR